LSTQAPNPNVQVPNPIRQGFRIENQHDRLLDSGKRLKKMFRGQFLATLAWHCLTAPECQHEFVAPTGRKMLHWGCLGPQGGCWGPVLPFSSCRLVGQFWPTSDPRQWPFGVRGFHSKPVFITRQLTFSMRCSVEAPCSPKIN
jgi:hypothetical protein